MGQLYEPVILGGKSRSVKALAFFDTGAEANYLRPDLPGGLNVLDLGLIEFYPEKIQTIMGDGVHRVKCDLVVIPTLDVQGRKLSNVPFGVLDSLGEEVLIGHPTMQLLGIQLDLVNDRVVFRTMPT